MMAERWPQDLQKGVEPAQRRESIPGAAEPEPQRGNLGLAPNGHNRTNKAAILFET